MGWVFNYLPLCVTIYPMRMRSTKKVVNWEDYLLPFKTTFPVSFHVSVGKTSLNINKNSVVKLSYSEYEVIANSSYAKYLFKD